MSETFGRDSSLSLEQGDAEAEMEESLLKPTFLPFVRGSTGYSGRICLYYSSKEHLAKDCPKIAARKRNGTWEDGPPKKGGAAK